LTIDLDDGIVVLRPCMSLKTTLDEYLAGEETTRPRELAYGVVRDAPAPGVSHQLIVGRLFARLERHVERQGAGLVVASPVDVVLDAAKHLVVQPDIAFIDRARGRICRDRIWGAPDLVVEVLSYGTRGHDRRTKLAWYRRYGVRECWIVDPVARTIDVVDLTSAAPPCSFEGGQIVRSRVLPRLRVRADAAFPGRRFRLPH
jgi:Uma2 family endonuclease